MNDAERLKVELLKLDIEKKWMKDLQAFVVPLLNASVEEQNRTMLAVHMALAGLCNAVADWSVPASDGVESSARDLFFAGIRQQADLSEAHAKAGKRS